MFKRVMISMFICIFVVTSVYAAEKLGTPLEARNLVEKAVSFVTANGEEKALKEFSNPKGKFLKDDLYVFAYDLKGVVLAHPMSPKIIGKNLYNEPDHKGKLFRKEIVDIANSHGSGWVDYYYMNPSTKKERIKITYFHKVGNLIVCCGAYLP